MKSAVLFDLDGTLWDSSCSVGQAWNECLEKIGDARRYTPEEIRSFMGMPMDAIAKEVFKDMDLKTALDRFEALETYENQYLAVHGGQLYPGLREALQLLHQEYFLGIVSNCQKGYIEMFLEVSGLGEFFDDIESYGNTLKYKDENIRLLMERNQLDHAVYVGDTNGDYDAAIKAGISFIHADYGFQSVDCRHHISGLHELEDKVKEVFSNPEQITI